MYITPIIISKNNYNNQNNFRLYSPTFKMNMSDLKAIDRFVAKKYKINPQPIKTLEGFQDKCKEMVEIIAGKDFLGRRQETIVQRKAMLKEWYNYVVKENGAYTSAMALMILAGITNNLKPKEDTLPPVLNKGVLADTVTKIEDEIKNLKPNEEAQINFEKEYRLNLQKSILNGEKEALDENLNGWIIIPSWNNDKDHFEANVDKLKMLSHDNWCTKSFNAEPYLKEGDFHVYMEKGKPKLGVRFVGDKIEEIQGELNNSKIPFKYGDIAKEHIKNYELSYKARRELTSLEKTKAKIKEIQKKFPNGINNYPVEEIFKKFGIKCTKDKNIFSASLENLGLKSKTEGSLIISHYSSMVDDDISFSDLGIDENRLIKNVKRIERYAHFVGSQITSLDNLESIGEWAAFQDSQITSLGKLKSIGGWADFKHSKITSLGNLQSIGGSAYFQYSQITSLDNLKSIGGHAWFENSQVTSLGSLRTIDGDAWFKNSQVTNLGNLQSINGCAYFSNSQITDLGNLQSIGGDADFSNSQITSLGNLQSIGGNVWIQNSPLTEKDFASIEVKGKIITSE